MKDNKYQVLIIDDEPEGPVTYFKLAMEHDEPKEYVHEPMIHTTPDLKGVELESVDLVLLDYKFKGSGLTGISVLNELIKINESRISNLSDLPQIRVILYSAFEDLHIWKQNILWMYKKGVADFVSKDDPPILLKLKMDRALDLLTQEKTIIEQEKKIQQLNGAISPNLIGNSPGIKSIIELIDKVSPTNANVLIQGETGTGKELVAKAIHAKSPRSHRPFISVSLGALPESLAEAELFGWEKGAFTGSTSQRKGFVEMANKGTLFLDEMAEISPKTQINLLRVLQERAFMRLGGNRPIEVDFRLICATNQNLEKAVNDGNFRQDLFYRLNVVVIDVMPLRERKKDIAQLANEFVKRYGREYGKRPEGVSGDTLSLLMDYNWPGNIRELENVIERSVVLIDHEKNLLSKDDIQPPPTLARKHLSEGNMINRKSFDPEPIVEILIEDRDRANELFVKQYGQDSFDNLKKKPQGETWQKYNELRELRIDKSSGFSQWQKLMIAEEVKKALEKTQKKVPGRIVALAMGISHGYLRQFWKG